jgi:HEAT repeat protein
LSLDTLLTSLEAAADAPSAKDLTNLNAIRGEERERFLDVWRRLPIDRRRGLIDRLAAMAEDNVELDFSDVFKVGLLDDDVQVRAESVKALWEYEGEDIIGVMVKLLADPEAIVRGEAALGLGRYLMSAELEGRTDDRVGEAEQALRTMARDERELTEVRGRAIEALGVRSEEWVRDLIEDAYSSGDRRLRISAIHAMGRNADSEWLPLVLEEMESDDGEARFEAAAAAGNIGDEDAVDSLAALCNDEDTEVQEAAISALGQIGGPAARAALHGVAAATSDERILEAITDALAEADFLEDPLGIQVQIERSVAEDWEEEADEE